jgi:tetratricopeptide (TPR) repeat protein
MRDRESKYKTPTDKVCALFWNQSGDHVMIKRAQKHLTVTFKESFIPVVLVAIALSAVLIYVNFKAVINANQVVTIQILDDFAAAGMDDLEGVTEDDMVQFSQTQSDDPLYLKAAQAVEQQHWQEAEKIYQQILVQQPSSQAHNDLGVVYYQQNQLDKAFQQYTHAIETQPVYINAFLNRGLISAKRGDYSAAIADYSQMVKTIPHHYQAHFNMGVAYLKAKDYDNAVQSFEKASQQAGGERKAKALYNLGLAYLNAGAGSKAKAERAFTSAIRIRPDYIEARLALADMAPKSLKGREQALQQIEKVLDLKPNYPPAYFRIAQIHSDAGDKKAARDTYIQAIQHNPQYAKARYNLALLYLEERRWADARAQFEWIREQEPNNAIVHFQLGRSAYGEKDYVTALSEYRTALDLKGGKYAKALLNIGLVYKAQKKTDLAIAAYQNLLQADPKYPEAWYNLGLVYMQNIQYREAEDALLAAATYDKNYSQAWFNLGVLYSRMDQDDKAINAYQQALKIRPGYQKAQLNLAVRYAKNNQYAKAVELYTAVLEKDPNYASAWLNIGIAYVKQGKNNEAETALAKTLELEPESVRARRFLAEVYITRHENALAVVLLQEALDRKPDSTSLRMLLSKAYRSEGKIQEARSELEKALKLEPGNVEIKKELDSILNLG